MLGFLTKCHTMIDEGLRVGHFAPVRGGGHV